MKYITPYHRHVFAGIALSLTLLVSCAPTITPTRVAVPSPSPISVTETPALDATFAPSVTAAPTGLSTGIPQAIDNTPTAIPEVLATEAPMTSTASPVAVPTKPSILTSPLPSVTIPLGTVFGIEMSSIHSDSLLAQFKTANVRWIRRTAIPWRLVEPEEGQRNWAAVSGLEQELRLAATQGFKVVLVVREVPAWAQAATGYACGPIKADKNEAFGAFMRDLVSKYSPAPYNVRYWEIWNEPDIAPELVSTKSLWGCWGDSADKYYGGGVYGEMLKTIYPIVKSVQNDAQVLVGGLLLDCDPRFPPAGKDCLPARFLEGILATGAGDAFDGVAFHAYDYYDTQQRGVYGHSGWGSSSASTGPVITAKAAFIREVLGKYNASDKFLMNTEMALVCGVDGTEARCLSPEYADTKASYIVQAYASSIAQNLRAGVWFSLSGWRGSGLIDSSGDPTSSAQAFQFAASVFRGVTTVRPIAIDKNILGYEMSKADGRLWVIWSRDGGDHTILLSDVPRTSYDFIGSKQQPVQSVTISSMPTYLVW